ncbi:MAG: TauD/TfdA family dioxygenase [Alphaproteobacteria bacterium]|nr:TauD/TfdA family dioxygenase [Alphaproteobacteria bacterium]MBU2380934.1 TauD/TfdA family dioxygenase [Alphaproteobacteria bacterium]
MPEFLSPTPATPYAIVQAGAGETLDAVPTSGIGDLFREHGAVLMRGFPLTLDDFRAFTDVWCVSSVFNESPDRQLLDAAHNIQSVNGGSLPFPLHPELSREPWKPDVCFFLCLQPPVSGGETTVCDGAEIVRRLPEHIRDAMAARRLLYIQPAAPETLAYWLGTATPTDALLAAPPASCPYRFVRTPAGVMRVFTRPMLHRTRFGGALAFGNFLLFARDYLALPNFPVMDNGQRVPDDWVEAVRRAAEPVTAPIPWRQGDLVMIDNSRVMHGRRAIVDADNRLIASYFGYLRDATRDPEEPADPPWRRAMFRPPVAKAGVGV